MRFPSLHVPTGQIAFSLLLLLYVAPQSVLLALIPPCPFRAVTGLLCPGCGATRAVLALLHGHLDTAFQLNPFAVILVPLALVYSLIAFRRRRLPVVPPPLSAGLLASAFVFAIVRNLRP